MGRIIIEERWKYRGEIKNGLPHGNGVAILKVREVIFSDLYKYHQIGEEKSIGDWVTIYRYKGEWVDGMMDGEGVCQYSDRTTEVFAEYRGEFKKDRWHGNGKLILYRTEQISIDKDFNTVYIQGSCEDGKMTTIRGELLNLKDNNELSYYYGELGCRNIFWDEDGAWYGDYSPLDMDELKEMALYGLSSECILSIRRHGFGYTINFNGSQHEGLYERGMKHGIGAQVVPNKYRYEGEFVKDMREGYGICKYFNGSIYKGKWKNDNPDLELFDSMANVELIDKPLVDDLEAVKEMCRQESSLKQKALNCKKEIQSSFDDYFKSLDKAMNAQNTSKDAVVEPIISKVNKIFDIVSSYRNDEKDELGISKDDIYEWILQFMPEVRSTVLTELHNILSKRYYSKVKSIQVLYDQIDGLREHLGYDDMENFLSHVQFLNLQPEGKSQSILLNALDNVLLRKHKVGLNATGTKSNKISIYIDDVLCTGLTMVSNIKQWAKDSFSDDLSNKEAVEIGRTKLYLIYICIHKKNLRKKFHEIDYKISTDFSKGVFFNSDLYVENEYGTLDILIPQRQGQSDAVLEYQNFITNEVDEYTDQMNWERSKAEFYRGGNTPSEEILYSSAEGRIIFENEILKKGIEIIRTSSGRKNNIRALGYSLPSAKDFGFGALFFTWRNIPNNSPLAFWYSKDTFKPLFKVRRSS